jgi:hypothetical protein
LERIARPPRVKRLCSRFTLGASAQNIRIAGLVNRLLYKNGGLVYNNLMGNLPRIKIDEYYEQFKPAAVTFTKEVIQVTGLLTKMVNLKCGSDFFPCVIYSTSFEMAKIVANNKSGIVDKLKQYNNSLSLRYCFKIPATDEQVAFLVPARSVMVAPYNNSEDMSLFTLQYSQRPPDDLIEIMGRILDANYCFSKRRTEEFQINDEAVRKMHFFSKEVGVSVDGTEFRCVPRSLSFGGISFIMRGATQDYKQKTCSVKFEFHEPRESYSMSGTIENIEIAVGHPDIAVISVNYGDVVPMTYKARLCSYISTLRSAPTKKMFSDGAAAIAAAAATPVTKIAQMSIDDGAVATASGDPPQA